MKDAARTISLLSGLFLFCGCARYEYNIIEPPDLAQHIGGDQAVTFSRNGLLYRMRSYENRLVIQISNTTPQPILLVGGQSYVVDPQGQSHSFAAQTIGPQSFIKLILPPLPPESVPTGPIFSIGIGVAASPDEFYGPGYFFDRPHYLAVIDSNDEFWKWEGESNVMLSLAFSQAGAAPFTHRFVFHRQKM